MMTYYVQFLPLVMTGSTALGTLSGCQLPWCINTGKSLIPLTLRFLAQKRNLLIPLELSRVMHQGRRMVQFGAIRSRQKVVQLLAEILKQKSQWRFRRV